VTRVTVRKFAEDNIPELGYKSTNLLSLGLMALAKVEAKGFGRSIAPTPLNPLRDGPHHNL
jgi:hypothetical protein